ncbi:uncharacterized protein LOC129593348 [Paramacrobiotus metropolitanus]|uniref:uncharacterized protein LOC129593348 n=1 Tax=Paramacrobiotus metropolitanus TaxID=2943436 RepID=UPI002445F976|nr:uncharacterized protein LOC129593348 [Paramacrobiotus metropolitanus]
MILSWYLVVNIMGIFHTVHGAGYLYGPSFSPLASSGMGAYMHPSYRYGYPSPMFSGMGMGPMGVGGSMDAPGFLAMGMVNPLLGDWTAKNSAFGLGYGFPMYG